MQQPFPPYNQQTNSGHYSQQPCGCSEHSAAAHAGSTVPGTYPQHDQNQYQYYATETAPTNYQNYQMPAAPGSLASWFDFSDQVFLRGFIAGAGITILLTNPSVKKSIIKGVVNLTSAIQGGVEEVKEQVQDIKAEMSQKD